MSGPAMLDIGCRRGGAGDGYRRAGLSMIGVDIADHEYPCGPFYRMDGLEALQHLIDNGLTFDGIPVEAIHMSWPCQRWSTGTKDPEKHPDLITPARPLLEKIGLPYVIENVPAAPLKDPVMLCGSSFFWEGRPLGVRRHRMFETNFPLRRRPNCQHKAQGTPVGVYGDHPCTHSMRPDGTSRGRKAATLEEAQRAMGIDWMEWGDLKEAIPPAYTFWIGEQLMEVL